MGKISGQDFQSLNDIYVFFKKSIEYRGWTFYISLHVPMSVCLHKCQQDQRIADPVCKQFFLQNLTKIDMAFIDRI